MVETGPVEQLRISPAQLAGVVEHLRAVLPDEGCGLLAIPAADDRVVHRYPIRNVAADPRRHYLGEPLELLEALLDMERRGWRLGAIYHSHPHGPAWPSAEDVRQAYYPSTLTLLVSLTRPEHPIVRLFAIRNGTISERRLLVDHETASED